MWSYLALAWACMSYTYFLYNFYLNSISSFTCSTVRDRKASFHCFFFFSYKSLSAYMLYLFSKLL